MGQKIPASHRCLAAWQMTPFLPTPLPFPLMSPDFMFCYFKETNPELYTSQIPWASLPGATRHGLVIHIYGENWCIHHLTLGGASHFECGVRADRDSKWISERQGDHSISSFPLLKKKQHCGILAPFYAHLTGKKHRVSVSGLGNKVPEVHRPCCLHHHAINASLVSIFHVHCDVWLMLATHKCSLLTGQDTPLWENTEQIASLDAGSRCTQWTVGPHSLNGRTLPGGSVSLSFV